MFCLAQPLHPSLYPDTYLDPYPILCPTPYLSRHLEPYPSHLPESYPTVLPNALLESLPEPYPSMSPKILPEHLLEFYPDTYPIRLTQPYPIAYPAELPYPTFSRLDFCLPDRTRPPYLTSLPGRETLHCPRLLTQHYPVTFLGWIPFNWPYLKSSSSASHLDLGLFQPIMHQDCSDNPKPTR
jgi:hypothetical protein